MHLSSYASCGGSNYHLLCSILSLVSVSFSKTLCCFCCKCMSLQYCLFHDIRTEAALEVSTEQHNLTILTESQGIEEVT